MPFLYIDRTNRHKDWMAFQDIILELKKKAVIYKERY
jgi:hypothetical protein